MTLKKIFVDNQIRPSKLSFSLSVINFYAKIFVRSQIEI